MKMYIKIVTCMDYEYAFLGKTQIKKKHSIVSYLLRDIFIKKQIWSMK